MNMYYFHHRNKPCEGSESKYWLAHHNPTLPFEVAVEENTAEWNEHIVLDACQNEARWHFFQELSWAYIVLNWVAPNERLESSPERS